MPLSEHFIFAAATLLLISVISSKASGRFGVPALLIFLGVGMLAGSEGIGGIHFDNPFVAQIIGIIALSLILFAGGISTEWKAIRPVIWKGISLSTLGVLITALVMAIFTRMIAGFTWHEALILGAIVSSTDAAAVFSILRSKNVSLRGNLEPLLELESGSNDPMAVFLTVGFIGLLLQPESTPLSLLVLFARQLILGMIFGYVTTRIFLFAINRLRLEHEGLYTVLSIGFVLLAYGLTATLGGSGFLAVYLMGLLLSKADFIHKNSVIRYHDGIAWLMQIGVFLVLGLLVFPSRLLPVAGIGLLLSMLLMMVARPVSVFVSLVFFRDTPFNERAMISWVGLRGVAPIILATFPLLAGMEKSDQIFNLVFFIVLTSVLLQGTLIPTVATRLGLEAPVKETKRAPLEFTAMERTNSRLYQLRLMRDAEANQKQLVELGFPKNALIVLIIRANSYIVPKGDTRLESGDRILILSDAADFERIRTLFEPRTEAA